MAYIVEFGEFAKSVCRRGGGNSPGFSLILLSGFGCLAQDLDSH
jgi:hypothetical protein